MPASPHCTKSEVLAQADNIQKLIEKAVADAKKLPGIDLQNVESAYYFGGAFLGYFRLAVNPPPNPGAVLKVLVSGMYARLKTFYGKYLPAEAA